MKNRDRRKKREQEEEHRPLTLGQEILQMSIYLLIVLCLTFLLIHYVGQRTRVQGDSMRPTLHNGDNLIVDKLSYRFQDPQRFDIIVFPYEHKKNTYYIKRIIGMPGEQVRIDQDGTIYINGEALEEDYGAEVMRNPGRAVTEITLGTDEYFVLGDNRNNSSDSRDPSVGNIHRDRIIGKAWIRIWPFSDFGFLKHQ
jgi:signal peptidase I